MPTPHIRAEKNQIAPAVIMPGDPKRAERIAHLLLDDAELVTDIRGMLGFTGTVQGRPLTVMGSGMGMPSATLYVTELFDHYDVSRIIRVGTCGGMSHDVKVGDVIVGLGAHTDSNMNQQRLPGLNFAALASFNLAAAAVAAADDSMTVHVGPILSKDHFYFEGASSIELLSKYGVLGVEMEAAGIYGAAAEFGREALTVLTVSDHLLDHGSDMSAEDRETKFLGALKLAVAAALS